VEALALHRQTIERDQLAITLRELEAQRRATQAAEAQREALQERLLTASREAGRAEVATGVLHNIGNVLNSMNTAASVINNTLEQSRTANLGKALAMLDEHRADLAAFLTSDARGQRLPSYLSKLAGVLAEEHKTLVCEMGTLGRSLEHIAQVVQMQQSYAKTSTVRAPIRPSELMEEALQFNSASIGQQNIRIVRQYSDVSAAWLDKHKVLQILINLISNAGNVLKERTTAEKQLTLRIEAPDDNAPDSDVRKAGTPEAAGKRRQIRFQVIDNGTGIDPANLTRIFSHGFTTRKDGHGFGLHSSANAAREMGGSLTAFSEGPDRGATFTLELPLLTDGAAPSLGEASDEKAAA
jgi:signal transduction histidine kinase